MKVERKIGGSRLQGGGVGNSGHQELLNYGRLGPLIGSPNRQNSYTSIGECCGSRIWINNTRLFFQLPTTTQVKNSVVVK